MASHNNKFNKAPLQKQGVESAKIDGGDEMFWIEDKGKGSTYVAFTEKDWRDLTLGTARL
jgi:hypothetical protein